MPRAARNYPDYRNATANTSEYVILDLAKNNRIHRLLAYEDIAEDLDDSEEVKLADFVRSAFEMSHAKISKRYDSWLEADRAHDVYVPPGTTNFREKAVISDTRAVSDTVLTYMMAALTGRNPMFQLEGEDRKARRTAAVLERILHTSMRKTASEAKIAQLLNDSIRYGFAPTKVVWDSNARSNKIVNFDPRRCFPDPRVNWGNWEDMQFIGFVSFASFDAINKTGLYPKLRSYPNLRQTPTAANRHGWGSNQWGKEEGRGFSIDPTIQSAREYGSRFFHLGAARTVNELWVRFTGHEVNLPGIDEIWLVATILDEEIVIRLQANPYGRTFPVIIGGIFHDFHKTYGQSLYDLMLPLHDIATWLLRSRIDNVQAALNNLIFADPHAVNIADLIDRNPWGVVRTLPGTKPGEGVFIAQVPDVTRGHWNDIAALSDLKQRVSAASDAQQGMPTADVRTATEIQRLTQLGSQRLGVLSRIQSAMTIRPLVRMMVGNIQDAITYDGSIRIDQYNMPGILKESISDGYLDFSIEDLQGPIDYMVIDGTLPTEPSRSPDSWLNTLQILSQTNLGMEYNLGLLAEEAIRAAGIHDLDKFRITPEQREQQGLLPYQQAHMQQLMQGATGMPQGQLQQEVDQGNLVPLGQAQPPQGGPR